MKNSSAIIISALFFILIMLFINNVTFVGTTFIEPLKVLGAFSIEPNHYGIIFEILAILLISSMLGAFYLASKEEEQ